MSSASEKALAKLVRKPGNDVCCDCSKRGPTYVNLSLGTFVCLECSGLLREFTFRIKGFSMSTFSSDELRTLKRGGGNAACNAAYFASFPPGAIKPDSSDVGALRAFLRRKYADKEWFSQSVADSFARASSSPSASASANGLAWSPMIQHSTSRKRLSTRRTSSSGAPTGGNNFASPVADQDARKSLLVQSAVANVALSSASSHVEREMTEDEIAADEEKSLRKRLTVYYKKHNPAKLEAMDIFVEWINVHGLDAFNEKAIAKYGGKGVAKRKKKKKKNRVLHDQPVPVRGRAQSTNPFDDVSAPSRNDFAQDYTPPPPARSPVYTTTSTTGPMDYASLVTDPVGKHDYFADITLDDFGTSGGGI